MRIRPTARKWTRRTSAGVCALALMLGACVPGGTSATPPTRSADLVDLDEIDESTATNAYDLLTQIRPNWLRGRGNSNLRGGEALPVVYVAGVRQGSLEVLRGLSTLGVRQLRFIDAPTATMRYGSGHSGGIIEVLLRRR